MLSAPGRLRGPVYLFRAGWRPLRNVAVLTHLAVQVIFGTFEGLWGTVDSVVCQKSYDYPDEVSPGYHMALEDGKRVTLRWDQVV